MYLDVSKIRHSKEVADPVQTMSFLQVDFTKKCMNTCMNCGGMLTGYEVPDWPIEKVIEVLDTALGEMSLKTAFLDCEAEFTMYPHAVDVIDYIEDNFSNVLMVIDTNSTVIPEGLIERLNTLSRNQLYLSTSLWAWDRDSYEKYEGSFLFDTVIKNIKTCLTQINNKNVTYATSIVYWNEEQFNNTCQLLCKIITDCGKEPVLVRDGMFSVDVLSSAGTKVPVVIKKSYGTVPVDDDFNDDTNGPIFHDRFQNRKVQLIVKDASGVCIAPGGVRNNCALLGKSLIVKFTGDVMPCIGTIGLDSYKEGSIGNIYEQKVNFDWIKKITHSQKYKAMQWRNVHDYAFDQCKKCVSAQTL